MNIKVLITLFFIFFGLSFISAQTVDAPFETQIKDGDIVFIKTNKANGLLPNGNSKYNYAGVIFI